VVNFYVISPFDCNYLYKQGLFVGEAKIWDKKIDEPLGNATKAIHKSSQETPSNQNKYGNM
jgi:hypothetical protein